MIGLILSLCHVVATSGQYHKRAVLNITLMQTDILCKSHSLTMVCMLLVLFNTMAVSKIRSDTHSSHIVPESSSYHIGMMSFRKNPFCSISCNRHTTSHFWYCRGIIVQPQGKNEKKLSSLSYKNFFMTLYVTFRIRGGNYLLYVQVPVCVATSFHTKQQTHGTNFQQKQ